MIRYRTFAVILLVSFFATIGCRNASDESDDTSKQVLNVLNQDAQDRLNFNSEPYTIDSKDRSFLTFGKYFEVKEHSSLDFLNPHEVAAHAVWMSSQGQAKELLLQMPHVETDLGLGEAFVTFLKVFGPDLEQFRNDSLKLKFHAYTLNDDTSVWYYYLFNVDGCQLEHTPWVSLHRSRSTGRCALTGIFLYDPEIGEPGAIPSGLITTLESDLHSHPE